MKFKTRSFLVVIFVLFATIASNLYSQNTIQGTVRYADDNSVVTTGLVKAFDANGVLMAWTPINTNGTYMLNNLAGIEYDLIGLPDSEPEADYPPTGYPNTTDLGNITGINALGTVVNKDIYVQRIVRIGGSSQRFSIAGVVSESNVPVANSVVYATRENKIYGYSVSDNKGNYKIESLPAGDYILVVHRVSDNSSSKNITLGDLNLRNVDFNIKPLNNNKGSIATNSVAFNLKQNYPNPFNPTTLIGYTIPKDSHVSLKVYDALGKQVAELVNAYITAGTYTARFDAIGLASGIYYYKLVSESYEVTKVMMLVK